MAHRTPGTILSFFLRFLVCFLIVATTSVLAAFAWDHSDNVVPESAPARADARSDTGTTTPPGR